MTHQAAASSRVELVSRFLDRYFFWLGLLAVVVGALWEGLGALAPYIPLQVAFSMFVGGINVRWGAFLKAARQPGAYAWMLPYLFIIMPAFSWAIARLAFPAQPKLATGLIFAAVLPCGITGAIWTLIARGNMALNLSMVTLTTLASGLLTPWLLKLWAGAFITIDVWSLARSLVITVVVPVVIGLFVHERWPHVARTWQKPLALEVKGTMLLIVAVFMAAAVPDLQQMGGWGGAILILSAFLHLIVGHFGAYLVGRGLGARYEEGAAFAYASGVRNTVAGAAIASTQMSPQVALPLLVVLVLSQPVGSLTLMFLGREEARQSAPTTEPDPPGSPKRRPHL